MATVISDEEFIAIRNECIKKHELDMSIGSIDVSWLAHHLWGSSELRFKNVKSLRSWRRTWLAPPQDQRLRWVRYDDLCTLRNLPAWLIRADIEAYYNQRGWGVRIRKARKEEEIYAVEGYLHLDDVCQ